MELTINDLAFKYLLDSKYDVSVRVNEFIDIMVELRKQGLVKKLVSDKPIRGIILTENYCIEQLLNDDSLSKDRKSLLRTMLVNLNIIDIKSETFFSLDDNTSKLCFWAYENGYPLISLNTCEYFSGEFLHGFMCKQTRTHEIDICNISNLNHIQSHKKLLQIRIYENNPKHKVNYGWGSPMDLNSLEAQSVLNNAIICENNPGHLVNKYNNKYYSFRCHHDNRFHGYVDNTLSEKIKRVLDTIR